jgi:hypothetical protein
MVKGFQALGASAKIKSFIVTTKDTKSTKFGQIIIRNLRAFVVNPILVQHSNAGLRSCQSVALWYAAAVFKTV